MKKPIEMRNLYKHETDAYNLPMSWANLAVGIIDPPISQTTNRPNKISQMGE